MKIDKQHDFIVYNDDAHVYVDTRDDVKCISVTTLIHNYVTPFDEKFWSKYKAVESLVTKEEFAPHKKKLLLTKKFNDDIIPALGIKFEDFEEAIIKIIKAWDEKRDISCERGTKIHAGLEQEHYKNNTPELKKLSLNGDFTCKKDYYKLDEEKGVYPEYFTYRISPDKKLRIAGQVDLLVKDGTDLYVLDYKGLDIETPILTTTGFKSLKNITKDDIIFDKDGNETSILNISKIHHNPCYKIKFDNGDEIIADHEHRWLINFRLSKTNYKEVILTTEELIEAFDRYKNSKNSRYLPKILNAKALNCDEKDLPIDPYVLGSWLGDGTSVAGSITTGENSNLWEELEKRGYEIGDNVSGRTNIQTRTLFGLRTKLRKLNLLSNKHIPTQYLLSSYEQRLDLLRGFMDADGYYNNTRKRFVMATTREYQADYLVSLLATLGVKPSKIYAKKYCNGKTFDGWDVCFTMQDNPFLLRNQENIEIPLTNKSTFRNIKFIEKVETIPTKCLEVDSPSHTFLFGYQLIPTHNTNEKLDEKSYYDPKQKKNQMMNYPLNNLMDCNMVHYQLQMSTYAWMLEKNNPGLKVKSLTIIHYDHDGGVTDYELEYIPKDVERMLAHYKKQSQIDAYKEKNKSIVF